MTIPGEAVAVVVVAGIMVACYNDAAMSEEGCWSTVERVNTFVRAVLAWPTYLAEELLSLWHKRKD